jgi:predicted nucleic acid-binding protein
MIGTERLAYVFDTFAWIEELGDGPFRELVHGIHVTNHVGTPGVVLAEIAHVFEARAPEALDRVLGAVTSTSVPLALTNDIAIAAGKTRALLASTREGIGLVDCIALETARAHRARLLTGDPHLRGLDGVEFLG